MHSWTSKKFLRPSDRHSRFHFLMKTLIPTAILAVLSTTLVPSHQAHAATPTASIKEVVSDCEDLEGDQITWKGGNNESLCVAEAGIGFNKSKGLRIKCARAGNLGLKPEAMIGTQPLDVNSADGYMFWVKAVDGGAFSLEFKSEGPEGQRFSLGEGVLAMDTTGNFLDPKEYLAIPRNKSLPAWIKLPTDFEGWIIVPSTVSTEGQNTGWKCPDPNASGQPVPPIRSLLLVTGDTGEFHMDHFSLYQAKH